MLDIGFDVSVLDVIPLMPDLKMKFRNALNI